MDVEEDNWSGLCEAEDHSRTIVHLDLDCFYAQVEELQDPSLKGKPLGVKQKQIIVTCNYAARARGVTKCMFLKDALEVCPELQLRCGEDLAVYRRCSAAVTATLAATGCPVERLGMDENWVDVSKLVIEKLSKEERLEELVTKGNVVGGSLTCSVQDCDCDKRIQVGSIIAAELAASIFEQHKLTCSVGVSYNKLLSKVGGSLHKPAGQTIVPEGGILLLLPDSSNVTKVPGLGSSTAKQLATGGILTLGQLRKANLEEVQKMGISKEISTWLRDLAWGRDPAEVKMSGRAASIGLEDRFMGIKDREGVREKLAWLINRLAGLVAEDGRKPSTMKVTMRDSCKDRREKRTFSKESRQCRIPPRIMVIKDEVMEEAVGIALGLVCKMVNFKAEFQLTLLGVAVTDFVEEVESKASIKNFFCPKKAATNENSNRSDTQSSPRISPIRPTLNNGLKRSLEEDSTDTSQVLHKSRKVEANAVEEDEMPLAGCDPDVWAALPSDLQRELRACKSPTLGQSSRWQGDTSSVNQIEETEKTPDTTLICPPDLDPEVFRMLPEDIKEEIEAEARAQSRRKLKIVERTGDLFSAPAHLSLVHCISQDCAMGKGIAKQFAEKFGRVGEIKEQHVKVGGVAILEHKERYIYNLVTKEKYHEKPTMTDLRKSLLQMRKHMQEKGVEGIAMPRIGSGLDLLDWRQVRRLLEEVFENTSFNIVIYTGLSTKSKTNESILKYFSKK